MSFRFYLAGPIWFTDYSSKFTNWRTELAMYLTAKGHQIYDPTKKEHPVYKFESKETIIEYRIKYGFSGDETQLLIDWIFEEDLRLIKAADAIVALIPKGIFSFGTAQELFFNHYVLNKLNFVITDLDLVQDCSVFLQKTTTKFFQSTSDFLRELPMIIELLSKR